MISKADERQLVSKGISKEDILTQIKQFEQGIKPISLNKPASIGDGILVLSKDTRQEMIKRYERFEGKVYKFVPASGAATRMFKHLFEFIENYNGTQESYRKFTSERDKIWAFFKHIDNFAFYLDLKTTYKKTRGHSLEEGLLSRKYKEILKTLLLKDGLNYGQLPKGLLKFHQYPDDQRTPAHEQLMEGIGYAKRKGCLNVHFTVSPEHLDLFKRHLNEVNERISEVNIHIEYSIQKPNTDTIAVDEHNVPFRDKEGQLLFRPAGHGALLENLNELDTDIVYIKNIDNVIPDRLKLETVAYKKALAGVLLVYQEKAFTLLEAMQSGKDVSEETLLLLNQLGVRGDFDNEDLFNYLNRPIRVCGMVKNAGEPGGGPFWINASKKMTSLQIVESTQIDHTNPEQKEKLNQSSHFNPVDIVCGLKNYQGEKFNLPDFRDDKTGFITVKSYNGRRLKALELPGLWNGGMAYWNTLFVEVPMATFNPVKTVNDLLKANHQL